ncbi:FHA domain-containing protein [Candidatus Woesearchaeota archaeon]|nr:FHA domain-containing protein [Candidatus Woesearchaeota archaeon]
MKLKMQILKGTWFRRIYKDHKKYSNKFNSLIESPHVKDNIEFLDKEFRVIRLKGHNINVGRNEINNIVLDDSKVSRLHCDIVHHMFKGWYVKDLGSKSGTKIKRNGKIFEIGSDEFKLEKDDLLLLGNTVLIMQ